MKKYKVYQISLVVRAIVCMTGIFVCIPSLVIFTTLLNITFLKIFWVFMPIIIAIFFLSFYIARIASTIESELQIDDKGIKLLWKKQFIFINKPDWEIRWIEIDNYVFESYNEFHFFKLRLKDGRKFKIVSNEYFDKKDDYLKLKNDFIEKIDELNNLPIYKTEPIKLGKGMWETNSTLVMGVLLFIVLICSIIHSILHPEMVKNWIGFILGALEIIGLIYIIYSSNQERFKAFFKKIKAK